MPIICIVHAERITNPSAVILGIVIVSVCPSVRPLHACFVTKSNNALWIFWDHTKGQSLQISETNSGWWVRPSSIWNLRSKWPIPFEKRRLRQIAAYDVSNVRNSEKSRTTNRKSTTGSPTSYKSSAVLTPSPPKGGSKSHFLFLQHSISIE